MKIRPDAAGMGPAIVPYLPRPNPRPPLTEHHRWGERLKMSLIFLRPDNSLTCGSTAPTRSGPLVTACSISTEAEPRPPDTRRQAHLLPHGVIRGCRAAWPCR